MKKFLTIPFLILAMLVFVSCVEEDDLEEGLSGDTAPAGDTTPADQTDTANPTDPADTGDTNPTDPTNPNDPTNPGDSTTPGDQTTDPTNDPTNPTDPNQPCKPNCGGKECGDDGCGGICGDPNTVDGCPAYHTCNKATNVCMCKPSCDNVTCGGDDGCGGKCNCSGNYECNTETNLCECIPHCEDDWECGDDGCGSPCPGKGCGEDGSCVESTHKCKTCTTVELSKIAESVNNNGTIYFKTTSNAYTPNTGDTTKDDKYFFVFKSGKAKAGETLDLSDNLGHCDDVSPYKYETFCFFLVEDHQASTPKKFLPQTGSITINSVDNGSTFTGKGAKINADLSGIKFGEIKREEKAGTITDPGLKVTIEFVPNGDCIIVNDTNLSYE